jgi:hypothetical protein
MNQSSFTPLASNSSYMYVLMTAKLNHTRKPFGMIDSFIHTTDGFSSLITILLFTKTGPTKM